MKKNLLLSLVVVATSLMLVGCGKKAAPVAQTEVVAPAAPLAVEEGKELAIEHVEEHAEGKELTHHDA